MSRKTARELAFKLIFSLEIQKEDIKNQFENFILNNEIEEKETVSYISKVFEGIYENNESIVNIISNNLKDNWSIERLSKIDISILKLATYELVYTDVPYKVVINEAVELAKQYGDDNSPSFINGVLAGVLKQVKE